jgi:tetratricopeptide (TPR) repeat protein
MFNQRRFRETVELHMSGRVDEAIERYKRLLAAEPDEPDILHLLGVAVGQKRQFDEALKLIIKAINLKPGVPTYYQNLAATYENMGDMKTAGEIYNKMGNAHQDRQEYEQAIVAYDKALAYLPDDAEKLSNRASALTSLHRYDEALLWLDKALACNPTLSGALTNRGNVFSATGRTKEALADHQAALKAEKNFLDGHINLGNTLAALGRNDEALAAYNKALEIDPNSALTHWDKALLLLLLGRFEEGWREYEWRWKWPGYNEVIRNFPQPEWKGEPPEALGGPLLVISEQGYGDIIQLVRYLPPLAAQGYEIIFETQPTTLTLLEEGLSHKGIKIISRGAELGSRIMGNLPFAAWTGMFSLPYILKTDAENIPHEVPYLTVRKEKLEKWRERFASNAIKPKIGLVWAGRPEHTKDKHRSIPPTLLRPLLDTGAQFYSLQKSGPKWDEPRVIDLADELEDFTDTAAAISALDLVITVDTSVAHLAGALGRPVWVLLPLIPDWRWLLQGDTSAWYPSMRLFRQETEGDWEEVIGRVKLVVQLDIEEGA